MTNTILLHGKHAGHTFTEILAKDLPYCEFMLSLKFVKPHFVDFVEFLKGNVPRAIQEAKLRQVNRIMK